MNIYSRLKRLFTRSVALVTLLVSTIKERLPNRILLSSLVANAKGYGQTPLQKVYSGGVIFTKGGVLEMGIQDKS